jgi:hypothetical protein
MFRLVRSLAAAIPTARTHRIEGAGHAAPFDAPANFVQLIADTITADEAEAPQAPTSLTAKAGATGLEPATSGVTGRIRRDDGHRRTIANGTWATSGPRTGVGRRLFAFVISSGCSPPTDR